MNIISTYIPMDWRHALARGEQLPERADGSALFADISGFTPLTEALALELGPKRGAEELTVHLNRVYDALIAELHRYGGSVVGFSGDAITCWLDGDDGRRATAAGLAMQAAMTQFAQVRTHSGRVVSLGHEGGGGHRSRAPLCGGGPRLLPHGRHGRGHAGTAGRRRASGRAGGCGGGRGHRGQPGRGSGDRRVAGRRRGPPLCRGHRAERGCGRDALAGAGRRRPGPGGDRPSGCCPRSTSG